LSVKIRMARVGRKNVALFRIVVADSHAKRDGRFVEMLGTYSPQRTPKEFVIKEDRVAYWLKQGASPSETVRNLLKQDRFREKREGLAKGLTSAQAAVERKPERKRKPKRIKAKKAE
jgi:small subunit ribosomal protein S16